ncbi:MAG: flagellar basal body rod protein FlgC [Deltaproteobacteria bacterium]|nr:flagellar basal body rod protein FlgC [Deltaproteobacteria bacterium]
MNIFQTMDISASGLHAQRQRLNVIAENLANSHTTRTPEGGPYCRKEVILASRPVDEFAGLLEQSSKVAVQAVSQNREGFRVEYDPGHPDADDKGMVTWPNVNPITEMVSLTMASRAFDANVAVLRASKAMALKALEIGR